MDFKKIMQSKNIMKREAVKQILNKMEEKNEKH